MNSTWNTNIALFEKRFPALKEILCEDIAFFEKETEEGRSPLPLEFLAAKNGSPTALYKADASGGNATGTNASGTNATGGNAAGADATGSDVSGGDATRTNASGGDASGTNATAGTGTNGDTSGGNAAKTDESGANAAVGDASGGDAAGGKATRTNATGTNATAGTGANGDASGGNAAVGDASGGDASGTNASGGNASGTNATAGTGTNGDVSGGNAAVGDVSGADAAGGNAAGADATGSDVSGGDAAGGDATGTNATAGTGTNGDASGGNAAKTDESGANASGTNATGTNATAGTGTNGDASGGNAAVGDVSGADAAGGKATRTNASGGNATGTNATAGTGSNGDASGGNAAKTDESGANAAVGDASGGDAAGGKATRTNATGTNATAGTGTNGDASGGNAAVGDVSGADAAGGKATRTNASGGNATGTNATAGTGSNGDASGGNAAKTDESGANAAVGDVSGGDAAGGKATRTNASGTNATGANASGTNATAGTGTNGDASGGNAAGADATGSDVSGANASGGDASGADATGTNATAGTGTNGDASGGNAAKTDESGANAAVGDASGGDAAAGKATRTNASGGNASGTNASGTNATAGTGTNGDASGGNAAKTDESGANAAKSVSAKVAAIPLHSKYNPEREAEQLVKEFSKNDFDAAVFLGFGLGYAPIAFAEKNPSTPLILIENNPLFLFAALNTLDFTKVFFHPNLIFVTKTNASTAVSVLANYKAERIKIYSSKAHTAHDPSFANEFLALFKRSLQKDEINTNTLEKFSRLWMKNSMANLPYLAKCDGVRKYRSALLQLGGKATELPFVILAAGPSLETVLPHLSKLKESCVLVCVDTALHALVKAGVEPDFIVLVDPQYACARHLEFLKAKSSVLITESAAYPSVFRFECRETVMCSSLFPIGQYFESQLGQKGKLGAGGSVATTAWDFARTCGTKKIYIAGMDLGFPGKQTHIRGSQFEERAHRSSSRTHTAESDGIASLLGASPSLSKDYRGNAILTDKRMSLFAWWFESNCSTALKDGQTTFTLTPQSLAIPNISISSPQELLLECNAKKEELMEAKKKFFEQAQKNSIQIKAQEEKNALPSFENVLEEFKENLLNLLSISKKGLALCQSAIQNRTKVREVNAKLSEIDSQILNSKGKDAAALVFPTERQLAAKAKELPDSAMNDPMLKPIYYSRLIYSELQKAVKAYLDLT